MASYTSTKERTNYARLCRANVDVCTDACRDSLSLLVAPCNILPVIHGCPELTTGSKALEAQQQKIIRNVTNTGSYGEFDITLLYKLIRSLSTQEIRNELCNNIAPNQILNQIQNLILTNNQTRALQQSSRNGNYDNVDDVLGLKLLHKLCSGFSLKIPPPTDGWGRNDLQRPHMNTFGDFIELVRMIRNTVYGHISNTAISHQTFQKYWTLLEKIFVGFDNELGSHYAQDLARIESMCMDDETEAKYIKQVSELAIKDAEVKEELKQVKQEWKQVASTVTGITSNVKHIDDRVGNIEQRVETRHSELGTFVQTVDTRLTHVEQEVSDVRRDVDEITDLQQSIHAQNILANTLQQLRLHNGDKTFIRTRAIKYGRDIMRRLDAVIFTGKGGSGKTKAALDVMAHAVEEDPDCIVLNLGKISIWDRIINAGLKYIVLLDDPIGKTNTDLEYLNRYENYWDKIDASVRSGNVKLIITIRNNILDECWGRLEKYYVFNKHRVVDITDDSWKLDRAEKSEIFKAHCRNNGIEFCAHRREEKYVSCNEETKVKLHQSTVNKIVQGDESKNIGFPQLCHVFSKDRSNTSLGSRFFVNPLQSLISKLDGLKSSSRIVNKTQYCVLVYILLSHRSINVKEVDIKSMNKIAKTVGVRYGGNVLQSVRRSMRRLISTQHQSEVITNETLTRAVGLLQERYISFYGQCQYVFDHESILEAIALSFYETNPEELIECCDKGLINELIRTQRYQASEHEIVIKIKQGEYSLLINRFMADLGKSWRYHDERYWWVDHPAMNDREFVSSFIRTIEREKRFIKIIKLEYIVKDGICCEFEGRCSHRKSKCAYEFFDRCAKIWLEN